MNRKQKALEERFRGTKSSFPLSNKLINIEPTVEREMKRWAELREEEFQRTRNCTIADIKVFIKDRAETCRTGYWLFKFPQETKTWERQVDELYVETKKHRGFILLEWDDVEQGMISLWKAKYTKLGRALQ